MNIKNKQFGIYEGVPAKTNIFDDMMNFINGKPASSSVAKAGSTTLKTPMQNFNSQVTKEFNDLKKQYDDTKKQV